MRVPKYKIHFHLLPLPITGGEKKTKVTDGCWVYKIALMVNNTIKYKYRQNKNFHMSETVGRLQELDP